VHCCEFGPGSPHGRVADPQHQERVTLFSPCLLTGAKGSRACFSFLWLGGVDTSVLPISIRPKERGGERVWSEICQKYIKIQPDTPVAHLFTNLPPPPPHSKCCYFSISACSMPYISYLQLKNGTGFNLMITVTYNGRLGIN
jgi:hypothetical protein